MDLEARRMPLAAMAPAAAAAATAAAATCCCWPLEFLSTASLTLVGSLYLKARNRELYLYF